MYYILFFVYLFFLVWLLTKSKFIRNAGLSKQMIILLFGTRVLAGVFNTWLLHLYAYADTWQFHQQGLEEYHLLFSNPREYFFNIFSSGYGDYGGFFDSQYSYWNDLKTNLMVKMDSVLNVLTFGNLYINLIIFNYFVFFGITGLYRVFADIYPTRKTAVLTGTHLLLSFLFFTTSFQKEGLVVGLMGVVVYCVHTLLKKIEKLFLKITAILVALAIIFLLRSYIFFALIPALAAWIVSVKFRFPSWKVFTLVYLSFLLLLFSIGHIFPQLYFPRILADKQAAFLQLVQESHANSTLPVHVLKPTITGIIKNIPEAIDRGLLRPYWTDGAKLKFLYPLAAEMLLYGLIFLYWALFHQKQILKNCNSFVLFGLCFSMTLILIIGYTVPVIGALVRYRSIYLPFLLTPLLCTANWHILRKK